jgi:hypothetical protein
MTRSHPRTFAAAMLAGLAVPSVCLTGTASAAPSHWETYHDEYGPEVFEDYCDVPGLTIEHQGVADGRFRTTTHGPDGFSYDHDRANFTDTYTNVDTEAFVTVVGSYKNDAHRITDNGDGTLTILVQGPGKTKMFNEDGDRIAMSTGLTAFELLFDHAGTPTDPSDDEFLEFLGFVKDTGRADDDCAALVQAIG